MSPSELGIAIDEMVEDTDAMELAEDSIGIDVSDLDYIEHLERNCT